MDRGAWRATYSPWGHKGSDMTEQLSTAYVFKHSSLILLILTNISLYLKITILCIFLIRKIQI